MHPLERAAKSVKCIAFWLIRCYAIRSFRSISMNYWRRILCFYALIWKYCVYIFWSVSVVAALTHSLARTRIQSNTPQTESAANATGTFIQITNKNGHQIYSFAFFWVVSLYFFFVLRPFLVTFPNGLSKLQRIRYASIRHDLVSCAIYLHIFVQSCNMGFFSFMVRLILVEWSTANQSVILCMTFKWNVRSCVPLLFFLLFWSFWSTFFFSRYVYAFLITFDLVSHQNRDIIPDYIQFFLYEKWNEIQTLQVMQIGDKNNIGGSLRSFLSIKAIWILQSHHVTHRERKRC